MKNNTFKLRLVNTDDYGIFVVIANTAGLNTEIARAVPDYQEDTYAVLCTVNHVSFFAKTENDIIDELLKMLPELSDLEIEIIDDRRPQDSSSQDKE